MVDRVRFPYLASTGLHGEVALRPMIPIALHANDRAIGGLALLDSGSDVNVLPFDLGMQLGLHWEMETPLIGLSGNMARANAKAIVLDVTVPDLLTVRLAFAWTQDDSAKLILGQTNFFATFDVCFYQTRRFFEVAPSEVALTAPG